jgi:hypothetical protein
MTLDPQDSAARRLSIISNLVTERKQAPASAGYLAGAPARPGHAVKSTIELLLEKRLTEEFVKEWPNFQRIFSVAEPSTQLLTNLFLRRHWTTSFRLAIRQVEELFCDLTRMSTFVNPYSRARGGAGWGRCPPHRRCGRSRASSWRVGWRGRASRRMTESPA